MMSFLQKQSPFSFYLQFVGFDSILLFFHLNIQLSIFNPDNRLIAIFGQCIMFVGPPYLHNLYCFLMFGQVRARRPPKNFSLLYIETNEVYFMSLNVSFLTDPNCQEIQGKLHLCSRSIFFEPKTISKPLLRIKLSCGVLLRMMKNIESRKLQKLVTIKKSDAEFKALVTKGPSFITLLQQEQSKKNRGKSPNLSVKLFEPLKKVKVEVEEKICSCIFIRVPKIFFIYRKPISPYITEKSEENYIFVLNKSNHKNRILRFLKLYDELTKCADEDKLVKSIIAATLQESAQEILETYQDQKLEAANLFKTRRVTIEGNQFGQFVLLKNGLKFIPVVNGPDNDVLEFTYRQVKLIMRYRYLFQNIGIELWLYNYPHSVLLVFSDHMSRETVYRHLKEKGEKIMNIQISEVTSQWTNGHISNVEYLTKLNMFANRSYNDLSQYPIFPWIIHNYDGEFDLKNAEMFRDLAKPIGAINKHRLRKLKDFYELQLKDKTSISPPHLYPTHYSTPGYVSYYLIRKIPEFIVRIQNGVFSPSDRIFRSVESAYFSSMNATADFKELIPEFYSTECDFLVNSEKLQMGTIPQGQAIDDVIIPKWASNAEDFLLKMRSAFQSDYVSSHINEWVDLIFGFKQSGTSAITFDNVFYHLTYQQNVNFDRPMSRVERAALQVQTSEFGQTPLQLFEDKHLTRKVRILNLQLGHSIDDKKLLNAKLIAVGEQNQRLNEQLQRQRYRFSKKLNEKQQMLMRNQKEKKKELQKMREMLNVDTESLKKFQFREKFIREEDKDVYIRQLEQLLKKRERENQEMNVIVVGLKRQTNDDVESVNSDIEGGIKLQADFFEDEDGE